MDNGVVVRDVWRMFGAVPALSGVSLTAPYGQVTALVGPNGAGKTTLLLILASLLKADRGEVKVAGCDPATEATGVRAQTGWMPDVFGVYDQLTVREYLDFFGDAYRLDHQDVRTRAVELLELVHLSEYASQPVHVLSRGQKQRLALPRALIHRPKVLLLDEPASGIPAGDSTEVFEVIAALPGDVTVLFIEHDMELVFRFAQRVAVLVDGRLLTEGTPSEIAADPRVRAVYRGEAAQPGAPG
jgi:ABC-2 type transport system ATP-binding protein